MADQTAIYNLALRLLGEGRLSSAEITADTDKRAKVLNDVFFDVRKATIAAYPWREAVRTWTVAPDPSGELLVDTGLDDATAWLTTDAAITVAGGLAQWDGSQSGDADLYQQAKYQFINGRRYVVKATVTSPLGWGTGTMQFVIAGAEGDEHDAPDESPTIEYDLIDTIEVVTHVNQKIIFRGNATWAGTVDNVSCQLDLGDWKSQYGVPTDQVKVWRFAGREDIDESWELALGGTVVRSDLSGPQRMVTLRDITDETEMSPLLVTALAAHLAFWAAPSLGKSEAKTKQVWDRYQEIVGENRGRNRIPGEGEEAADLDYFESIRA